jgi:hypothetical protein
LKLICFGDELLTPDDSAAGLLAKRLDLDFVNLAQLDTSNSRIHKTIVKYIINNNTDNSVFLIGWTSPYRLDAEYNNEYFSYRNDSHNYPNLVMNKLHKYDHYLFDRIVISQRWASILYGVQQMLSCHQIKYFMFNTQHHLEYNTYTEKVIRSLNNKLYYDGINPKSTMTEYLKNIGYKDLSVSAHDEYARFLSQKLRSNEIINKTQ